MNKGVVGILILKTAYKKSQCQCPFRQIVSDPGPQHWLASARLMGRPPIPTSFLEELMVPRFQVAHTSCITFCVSCLYHPRRSREIQNSMILFFRNLIPIPTEVKYRAEFRTDRIPWRPYLTTSTAPE